MQASICDASDMRWLGTGIPELDRCEFITHQPETRSHNLHSHGTTMQGLAQRTQQRRNQARRPQESPAGGMHGLGHVWEATSMQLQCHCTCPQLPILSAQGQPASRTLRRIPRPCAASAAIPTSPASSVQRLEMNVAGSKVRD